jgi:hypothetical protein
LQHTDHQSQKAESNYINYLEVVMSLNPTLNYLLQKFSVSVIPFSKSITKDPTYLAGAGGLAGDGFPIPASGTILGLIVWDKTCVYQKMVSQVVNPGDRISIYAEHVDSDFTVRVQVNGNPTEIFVTEVKENSDVYACVFLTLQGQ